MSKDDPKLLPAVAALEFAKEKSAKLIRAGADMILKTGARIAMPTYMDGGITSMCCCSFAGQRVLTYSLHPLFTATYNTKTYLKLGCCKL